MKILKFAPAFSRLSQTFIYGLACGLCDELSDGFRVLTLERENADLRPFDNVDVLHEVTAEPPGGSVSLLERIFGDADKKRNTIRFTEYFDEQKPDLVHAHFGPAADLLIDACDEVGVPLIVSLRGYDASRLVEERKWQKAYADIFPRCRAIVLITDEMRGRIEPLAGGVPLTTIHAGKNVADYPYKAPGGPVRRFLSIGRLVEKKGHGDAIRAISKARQNGADVSLRIIGEGDEREALQSLIDTENIGDAVQLVGRLSHDEVKSELRRADGFILACRTAENGDKEGVPNVLKEAQLMGLPVVSTRHAGIPDVIAEQNHRWLAAEGDVEGLAERVVELSELDDSALQKMAKIAREHVEEHFSRAREVSEHLELYSKILGSSEEPAP